MNNGRARQRRRNKKGRRRIRFSGKKNEFWRGWKSRKMAEAFGDVVLLVLLVSPKRWAVLCDISRWKKCDFQRADKNVCTCLRWWSFIGTVFFVFWVDLLSPLRVWLNKVDWKFSFFSIFSWTSVQSLLRARFSPSGKAKAATDTNHIYVGPAEGTGASLPGDALSRHLHERGNRHEDWFDRG